MTISQLLQNNWQENDILQLYESVPIQGLNSDFMNEKVYIEGKKLLDISTTGLQRRGYLNSTGQDESVHLEKLKRIISEQKTPADVLIEDFKITNSINSLLKNRYY